MTLPWLKTVSLDNFIFLHAPQVIKQRMQTGQFTSASGAVRFIASKEGFKGFYAVWSSPFLPFNFFFWTNSIPHVCNDMLNVSLVLIFEITGIWIFFVEGFTLWCYSILHLWADSNRLYACGKFSSSIFMCFRDTFVLVFFFAWHKFPFLFSFYIFEPENTLGFLPIHWNWKVK